MFSNISYKTGKRKGIIILAIILLFAVSVISLLAVNRFISKNNIAINFVSGTEYISGEAGQIIVRISDRNSNAVRGMDCLAVILYPNKTYFLLDREMVESSVPGNYFANFITPQITGVYEETVTCRDSADKTLIVSSSFHVSLALNIVRQIAENQSSQYEEFASKLNKTLADLTGLAIQINETRRDLDTKINETVERRFTKFYNDTIKAYQSMIDIFSK